MRSRIDRARPVLGLSLVLSFFSITSAEAIELLINGNFDSGSVAWVENDGGIGLGLITEKTPAFVAPHTGTFIAWLGGVNDVSQSLYQNVAVPPGATALQVRGVTWIQTAEIAGVFDHAAVRLLSADGSVTLETLGDWSNVDESGAWTAFAFAPLGNYAGQTVRLEFSAVCDVSLETSFLFDTIEFVADIATDVPHVESRRSWGSIKNLYR